MLLQWGAERQCQLWSQCRGAGLDERGGSEDEQCAAHNVARSTERMVSNKSFIFFSLVYNYKVLMDLIKFQRVRPFLSGPVEEVPPFYKAQGLSAWHSVSIWI